MRTCNFGERGRALGIAFGTLLIAVLLFVNGASAATLTVDHSGGADYTKIQDAINNASAGDTILVNNGTYYEEITLKSGLIIIGENPWSTIIDGGNNSGDIVTLTSGSATIKGFTIKGAISGDSMPGGAGIFINNAGTSLTAINNIIIENDYGIQGWNQVTLVAKNNIIARNNYNGVDSYIFVTLENNVIVNNGGSGWNDWNGDGNYTFENNIIVNNSWYGFAKNSGTPLYIEYNNVWNNPKGNYIQGSSGCCEYPFTPSPGTGELSLNPLFSSDLSYTLQEKSPLTDAGNPNVVYNDPDGSRNDMGIYGGQNKMPLPPPFAVNIEISGIPVIGNVTSNILNVEYINFSSGDPYNISITAPNGTRVYYDSGTLTGTNLENIPIDWIPSSTGNHTIEAWGRGMIDSTPVYLYDSQVVSPVPEPGTIVLVATGMLGLIGIRRRY
jgi:hypothetical protein